MKTEYVTIILHANRQAVLFPCFYQAARPLKSSKRPVWIIQFGLSKLTRVHVIKDLQTRGKQEHPVSSLHLGSGEFP